MFLVVDLLRALVCPECHAAVRTLHDDGWAETAEYAHLVVVGGPQDGDGDVEGLLEGRTACWARSGCGFTGAERGGVGAWEAEDVAASGYDCFVFEPVATSQVIAA